MGEVTDDEIIEIANNFLLNSPPGEFMEVVTGTLLCINDYGLNYGRISVDLS